MLARSKKSLRPLAPLDNVAVPLSQYDRSKGDPPNILGVIMSVHNCGYVVGTKSGVKQGKMALNQIEFIKFAGITDEDVPSVELSLREIVRAQSICGGQGYQKCNCQKAEAHLGGTKRVCNCLNPCSEIFAHPLCNWLQLFKISKIFKIICP